MMTPEERQEYYNQKTKELYDKLKADLPNVKSWLVQLAKTSLPKTVKETEDIIGKPLDQFLDIQLSEIEHLHGTHDFFRIFIMIDGKRAIWLHDNLANRLLNFRHSQTTQRNLKGYLLQALSHECWEYRNGWGKYNPDRKSSTSSDILDNKLEWTDSPVSFEELTDLLIKDYEPADKD